MRCAAPRNNTHRIRTEVRRIPVADYLEPLECFHIGIQGTGADPAIQGDGEPGGIPGNPLLPVILTNAAVPAAPPFSNEYVHQTRSSSLEIDLVDGIYSGPS